MREASFKRLQVIWFHLYDIIENTKLWWGGMDEWLSTVRGREMYGCVVRVGGVLEES